jgi:FAD dependent monooxygenase
MIYPSVARIFDQFGILTKIQETVVPVQREFQRWGDGSINTRPINVQEMSKKFDVPVILFDRQKCVTHLYDGLPDQSMIRTGARVERIEHTETGVKVYLTDGTFEEGDLVIGADGVHSVVRQLMWDYAAENEPDAIPASDKEALFTDYKGLFGVSDQKDLPGLGPSDIHIICDQDSTKLLFTQPGVAYWALVYKDEHSKPPKTFKPNQEDQDQVANRFKNDKLGEDLTFEQLWKNKSRSGLLNIEEGILDKWHAGRIVLVGDSAHKVRKQSHRRTPSSTTIPTPTPSLTPHQMTADIGMGANMAIESAATLCNLLQASHSSHPATYHPSAAALSALFTTYQSKRYERAKTFMEISGCDAHALVSESVEALLHHAHCDSAVCAAHAAREDDGGVCEGAEVGVCADTHD